ncbi:MAG: cellulase family glycosylhydrolase [Anaerolineae bacterium]|nr:cellulase family glycosylhydrolase [Anaerolineae bacterium]
MSLLKQNKIKSSWIISTIVLGAAMVIVLFLPPISLADRLFYGDYESIDAGNYILYTDDGAELAFIPVMGQSARVKLDVLPGDEFQSAAVSDNLATAIEKLPANLATKGPVYRISYSGNLLPAVGLTLPNPATENNHTLDLYAFNGDGWEWQPSRRILAKNIIQAELDFLPEAVAIMQTHAVELGISTDYVGNDHNGILPNVDKTMAIEINLPVFRLASDGRITGDTEKIPLEIQDADWAVIPTIRNAAEVDNLLVDPALRGQHLKALVDLVTSGEYQGVDLDYRGISPDLRQTYTDFLQELRGALPEDKQLSVHVALPQQMSTGNWDTGAYDWPAIGRIADRVKLPTWPDPKAYAPGGQMEQMLGWATGQINRYKIQLCYRPHSTEWVDGQVQPMGYEQALDRIGDVTVVNTLNGIDPGKNLDFTLSAQASTGIQMDDATGTYWFAYLDGANRHHTIYLANPARLVDTLELVKRYHLDGVAIENAGAEADEQMWEVLRTFQKSTSTPAPADNEYSVAWRVQDQVGVIVSETTVDLSQPDYQWDAPEQGGVFAVVASIFSSQNPTPILQGTLVVQVATPTPLPTATPTPTPNPTATPTPVPTSTPTAAPRPVQPAAATQQQAAPPPAVPAVNLPFGYGIQADPRGDTPANIGHIRAMGFNWVKFQMAWKDVESAPGDYAWAMWDGLINAYHGNGINILLSIPKSPDWARPPDDDKSVEGPPQDPNLYAQFVAQVANHYRGKVQAIEVWNEQNLWYEAGGMGRINAANYVQLLQASYRAIKAVNPEMVVVSGALTPAGSVGDAAVDDIDYLNQMYANGARGFFDALGAHPSGYNCPAQGDWRTVADSTATSFRGPFENRHHSWCFRGTMEGYREVMLANGDGSKAIVPTEFGWAVSGNPKPGYEYALDNTVEEQAQWIAEAYQMGKQWGWVGPMFLWNLDYGVTAPGTELASFGILNTPAYHVLAGLPK